MVRASSEISRANIASHPVDDPGPAAYCFGGFWGALVRFLLLWMIFVVCFLVTCSDLGTGKKIEKMSRKTGSAALSF